MRLPAVALALALVGCVYFVPDYKWRSRGERVSSEPVVFLHLGTAPQVCAGRDGIAEVTIFANLYNFDGPQEVRFVLNGGAYETTLFGRDLTLVLHRVKIGQHDVEVRVAGHHPVGLAFSVWDCAGGV